MYFRIMKRVHIVPRLRARLATLRVRHVDIAHQLGIHPSLLSAFLNERRELSPDFEKRITAAVDLLEEAEKAAQEARQRILAGQGT